MHVCVELRTIKYANKTYIYKICILKIGVERRTSYGRGIGMRANSRGNALLWKVDGFATAELRWAALAGVRRLPVCSVTAGCSVCYAGLCCHSDLSLQLIVEQRRPTVTNERRQICGERRF